MPIPDFIDSSYFVNIFTAVKKAGAALVAGECVLSTVPIPDFAGCSILFTI